ncbi:protein TASOR 2-like isoform X3 [Heptranchias perlo]|uniref:protein TASOR 2-like isoform X3 n=1 Tax=Heptranchias perlo TaxID=212740 RepID=UPI003559B21E
MKGRGKRCCLPPSTGGKMSSALLSLSCNQQCPRGCGESVSPPETFHLLPLTSSQFTQEILPTLQQAYLDSSSGSCFQYTQVTLVNNKLLEQYNACRLDMEEKGYSKEELAESVAFLLFETEDQAKVVCQKGLQVGNSKITTLGDPLKGVYLCKYSDFLHPTPLCHGKSGYILIFKIIKGRVKCMIENHTADYTGPSTGYNCHVSTNTDKVSSITSHFQAFELTQYYLFEFGQCDVLQCPRQIYPYAIVAFQYCDNKRTMSQSGGIEIFVPEIQVQYYPWKGTLINKDKVISVALKSIASALMPVVLPTKLEIEYVMNICELKSKLPQAVFEREHYKLKEVCLEGLYCSLYELVECMEGEANQLGPLIDEMKEKNLAVVKCLNDQGLLILFIDSAFSSTSESSKTIHKAVQAVFIYKAPRIAHLKAEINRATHAGRSSLLSERITPLLPGIGYAVTEGLKSDDAQTMPRNKLIEDYLVEYFNTTPELSKSSDQICVNSDSCPSLTACAPPNERELPAPGNCQRTAISQLSPYFTDPESYVLPIATVLKLQENCLKLVKNPGAKLCCSQVSEPKPPKAAIPRGKRISKPGKAQGKNPAPGNTPVENASPGPGVEIRAVAGSKTKQTDGEPCKNVRRANTVGKQIARKAVSKGAGKVKRKKDSPLPASATSKLGTEAEMLGIFKSPNCTTSSDAANAASKNLGYSTRSQSARNNKRTLVESDKGSSAEQPAPLEVKKKKKTKASRGPFQTNSKRSAKARKAVGNYRSVGNTMTRKLTKQRGQTVCVTGANTEQISRFGVCTWNIVENIFADDETASLQPLSLGNGSDVFRAKKTPEVACRVPQDGRNTNTGETDALNILADLAISSAIAALPRSRKKYTVALHQASGMRAYNKTSSVGRNKKLNLYPDQFAKYSDCLSNTELRVQNTMPFVAENHQTGSRVFSKNQPPHSAASPSLECFPCVTPAFSNREASPVQDSQTLKPNDLAQRSSDIPSRSHLGDHSYSRPPRDKEPVCLAVASPVLSEKEDVGFQSTSLHVESEKRYSAVLDFQNRTHTSLPQAEVCSRDEERSYEEGTLIGRVLPFRREEACWTNVTSCAPDPQKENDAMRKYDQISDCTLADSAQCRFDEAFQQSRYVREEKDTVKVTFEWKGPYLYQWDSKYTNDSVEKSVNRALHGPWDPTIQETMNEVKLILHMWIGLFYTKSSMLLQTSIRHVQERIETLDSAPVQTPHEGLARTEEPVFIESGSEPATSEKQQMAGVIMSSVIKRIEKNSNLVTSCDSNTAICGETLSWGNSQPLEERPLGSDSDINCDNMQDTLAQNSRSDLTHTASISVEEFCEQESTNDLRAENESQEQHLNQGLTPLSDGRSVTDSIQYNGAQDTIAEGSSERDCMDTSETDNGQTSSVIKQTEIIQQRTQDEPEVLEIQRSAVQTSTCPVSVAEKPRSADSVDDPMIENDQMGIIRQSSVIREVFGIQLQAQNPSRGKENMNSSNVTASGSYQVQNESSENRLQIIRLDNLTALEDVENTARTEDLGTIKDTLASERNVAQDEFDGIDHTDAASQSFSFRKHVLRSNSVNTSETSNVITHNHSRSLGTSNPLDNTDGPLEKGSTCSCVESCADIQLIRGDVTETQRKRTSVGKFLGEGEITSDSNSEFPDNLKCMSLADERRNQIKLQASSSQNYVENLGAKQKEKEFEKVNRCNDFDTDSERSDCGRDVSKEPVFTLEDFSDGSDNEIQTGARDFYKNKKAPRISWHASSQKRKRRVYREKFQCFSDVDSEHGNYREKWSMTSGHLQMRNIDMNYLPHFFEENSMAVEMSDSDASGPPLVNIPDPFGRQKVYRNFTVTAQTQQKPGRPFTCERTTRTFCNWGKKNFFTSVPDLLGPWNARCWNKTSPIQKILDLEYVCFSRHLNSVINRACTMPYAGIFSSSRDGSKTTLRRKNVQTVSSGRAVGSKKPLTVTISCQEVDQSSGKRIRNKTQISHWTNREDKPWDCQQEGIESYKPKNYSRYVNNRKRPCNQTHAVSQDSIEPADRMPSNQHSAGENGSLFADELLHVKRKGCKEVQGDGRKRIDPFLHLITELCSDLHQNLNEVVKETWKGTYKFYVSETNSDRFFKEIKEFLKKEGHVELGPLDLSVMQPHHSSKVLVIIRNEDISAHLHQIPYLAALKQMQCVQFVGVDSPGDIKDQTFQELFSSGGFVVSDGTVLDTLTPEHLQQISEQLSEVPKWKWMIHFKELKKLKEMARDDNTAKRKISVLTRKIAANIVEVLPFHECDSRSQVKPDYLSCLLNLQAQKISSRFAVFLTGKPENREVFTQSGILVTDVNSFTQVLRTLTSPLQSTLDTENAFLAKGSHSIETQLESPFVENTVTQNSQMAPTLF